MAAALLLMAVLSTRFLWIEIVGCDRVPQAVVLRALEEQGIKRFGTLPEKDFLSAAGLARIYDPRIAWITLEKRGATLVVNVTEHELRVPTLEPDIPCDVVACKDGVLIQLEAYEGRPSFVAGQAVTAGDVLIQGEFFPDTKEEVADPLRVHARGLALANVFYFSEYAADAIALRLVESGAAVPYRQVRLFGLTLYETPSPYEEYEIGEVTAAPLTDCMLPVQLVSGVCRELVEAEVPLTGPERRETALTGAETLAFLKIPKDAAIVDKKTAIVEQGGVTLAVVGVVTEESIGLTREIVS